MCLCLRTTLSFRLSFLPVRLQGQGAPFRSVGRTYSDRTKPTDKTSEKQHDCPENEEYGFTRRRSDYWPKADIQSLPPNLRPQSNETLDLILRQKVYLIQSRKGYRVNTDAHMLAYFASERFIAVKGKYMTKPLRVLDLGAGVGLVSILFAKAHKPGALCLIELQEQLVRRAKINLMLNDLKGNVMEFDIENGDLPYCLHGRFDVVLINPPFYAPCNHRKPPQRREKYLAHVETSASILDFLVAACSACDPTNEEAFVALIHDKSEYARVEPVIARSGMYLHRYQEMCHVSGTAPTRVLLELKPETYFRHLPPVWRESYSISEVRVPSKTQSEAFKILAWEPLILHRDDESQKYCDPIEKFLEDLPVPSLRIGRSREP
ncbi:tRNA1(Val) (adenine(37)-N6)-methyltransferase [Gracilariopsis chorda]|uniref:tRNA1(Val) (Adenine(37)-N6)-methyltransferase n=1 Tax=Gracilariopsis chorda TaxID=448386 RepID=A0A2V3IWZ7_9FLOR|nr:tRNA1(Val) (adenine(37)-N6)-methyltransferase [Gracilariopsis chorda]|eukprot:PXF46583.1 tRNA1(Val) (adenine(37)-N6)-methyltransferase [Gracilariopsis chorda]